MENLVFVFVFSSIVATIGGFFSYITFQSVVKATTAFTTVAALVAALITAGPFDESDNWVTFPATIVAVSGLLGLLAPLGWNLIKASSAKFALMLLIITINIVTGSLGIYFAGIFFSVMLSLIFMAAGAFLSKAQTLCQLGIDKNCLIFVKESNGSLTRIVADITTGVTISKRGNCRVQDAQTEVNQLYEYYSLVGELGDKPDLNALLDSLNK